LPDRNKKVNKETKLLSIAIQQYYKKLIFNIVKIITYNIVLEMSWLKQYNSEVDWNTKVFKFAQYNYIIYIQSTYRQRSIVDKKLNRKSIANSKLVFLQKNNLTEFDSIDTDRNQSNCKIRINK